MKIISFYSDKSEIIKNSFEENSGISNVVPDMSLSVREILARFRRGSLSPEELRTAGYYNDEDFPDIDPLEMSDVEDLVDYNAIVQKTNYLKRQYYEQMAENSQRSGDSNNVDIKTREHLQEVRSGEERNE